MEKMEEKVVLAKMLMLLTGKEEGFSLLEILIGLTIIAVFVAVNLPNLEGFLVSVECRGQLLKIEHFLQAIREMSISQQRRVELAVVDNGFLHQINEQESFNLKIKIVSRSTDKINYYPDGTSSGGSFSINISDNIIYSAVIDPVTGEIMWSN